MEGWVVGSDRANLWTFGDFQVDERRREVRLNGELVAIEPKPLNLLLLMLRHPGTLLTRNDLIDTLWTGRVVSDSVLANCVKKLRTVLNDDDQLLVRTVHGYGYRFEAEPTVVQNEAPAAAPSRLAFESGQSPPMRPHWRLVRRLGRSGEAWLAEHSKTRQKRVFKFGDEAESLTALKREVTIHRLVSESLGETTAVVPLLDWNFDEPPWFLEMDYCAGGSLEEWCEAQGGVRAVPLNQRIDIVMQIAETLSALHQLGVLHKDLKPANILIANEPGGGIGIRFCDFGSGMVLDLDRLNALSITQMGFTTHVANTDSYTGTPLYLAPEVIAGQPPTVRSDIYALGVILYQLVVGDLRRPMAPGWEKEIEHELLREDIAHAADGSPSLRLGDAAELAHRLRQLEERRTQREAERADRQHAYAQERALEKMRARRAGLIVAAAALGIGFLASAVLYLQARSARQAALDEAARAQAVSDFLTLDVLAQINSNRPVRNLTVNQLLDQAAASVAERFEGRPETAVRIYESIGRSYNALGQEADAARALESALALHQQHQPDAFEPILNLSQILVMLHYRLGDLPEQWPRFEAITEDAAAHLGATHDSVVQMKVSLARGRGLLGQWAESAKALEQVYQALLRSDDPDEPFRVLLEQSLAYTYNDLARYEDAIALMQPLIERYRSQADTRGTLLITANERLGYSLTMLGRFDEAQAALAAASALIEIWDPRVDGHKLTLRLYEATLRIEQQRPLEAIALLEAQLEIVGSIDAGAMDQSFHERGLLAAALQQTGRLADAESQLLRAIESCTRALGDTHPWCLSHRIALADVVRQDGRIQEAGEVLNDGPPLAMDGLPQAHPFHIALDRVRGLLWRATGHPRQAAEALSRAWRSSVSLRGPQHWRSQRLASELAQADQAALTADASTDPVNKRLDARAGPEAVFGE